MKIAVHIVRILIGLLYLFASVAYFFNLVTPPEMTGDAKAFAEGINAARYLMPLVKTIELVCAAAFLSGRYVALAAVLIAPVTINIFLYHVFVDRQGLPIAAFLLLGNLFLGYAYRDRYGSLFEAR